MESTRKIDRIIKGQATSDGAGVKLTRILGHNTQDILDPFLMLDFFGSDNPDDFMAGFPWHPHRGMETVTYMLDGKVEHSDSMGNSGVIGKGDIQWMTAGSGIIHQEMPKYEGGRMYGFQLWVNLPSASKMISPRYQDIPASRVPVVELENKTRVKVLAGTFQGVRGPVENIIADPEYFDVEMPENAELVVPAAPDHTVFAYLYEGTAAFDDNNKDQLHAGEGAIFGSGDHILVKTGASGVRFILIAGKPIGESIAWHGPIVMNTDEEIDIAFRELKNGDFIKS
ncbi:MAG: pirin family protein [Bacteroidetes bacterium]|nr:pirin family protein [Bacteroidota bacterium]